MFAHDPHYRGPAQIDNLVKNRKRLPERSSHQIVISMAATTDRDDAPGSNSPPSTQVTLSTSGSCP